MCVTDFFMEGSSTPTENSLRNEVFQESKIHLPETEMVRSCLMPPLYST